MAKALLAKSELPVITADSLDEGVEMVVAKSKT